MRNRNISSFFSHIYRKASAGWNALDVACDLICKYPTNMNLNVKESIQYEAKWPFSPFVLSNLKKTWFPVEDCLPEPCAPTSNRNWLLLLRRVLLSLSWWVFKPENEMVKLLWLSRCLSFSLLLQTSWPLFKGEPRKTEHVEGKEEGIGLQAFPWAASFQRLSCWA